MATVLHWQLRDIVWRFLIKNSMSFHMSQQYMFNRHVFLFHVMCLHALSWHESLTMHVIWDFVLCRFYEWPVMQISNESFIGAPLKAADSLRPEHVHDSDDDTVSYIWSFRSSPNSVYTVILAVLTTKALRLAYWILFQCFFE